MIRIRSSYQRCSVRIAVLKNFAKFTGKRLYQSLLFDKVADLRPATLLEKRFWRKCFPVNFEKFLITSYRIPLGDCFYRISYEYSRSLFFQLNCENTRTMRKCGPKSYYEGIKLLIVNVELKQISRSLQMLIFLLDQRKNCFDQNILSFHYFQCIKLWNAYTKQKCCEAKLPILDIYQMAYSYPKGTLDETNYKDLVFKTAKDALLVSFLNNIPVNKR